MSKQNLKRHWIDKTNILKGNKEYKNEQKKEIMVFS